MLKLGLDSVVRVLVKGLLLLEKKENDVTIRRTAFRGGAEAGRSLVPAQGEEGAERLPF